MSSEGHIEQLEMLLLRRSLGALTADRERCADCGRTPLTGEEMHLYSATPFPAFPAFAQPRRQRLVCELCRPAHRERPLASEVVSHPERGQAVRLTARAA
jgi:hypothetical protein